MRSSETGCSGAVLEELCCEELWCSCEGAVVEVLWRCCAVREAAG